MKIKKSRLWMLLWVATAAAVAWDVNAIASPSSAVVFLLAMLVMSVAAIQAVKWRRLEVLHELPRDGHDQKKIDPQ